MNDNRSGLIWGVLLIVGGALALLSQMGYIDRFSPQTWIIVFAAVSLISLLGYALGGWKQWPLLFPAGVFGGLAVTIWLAESNLDTAAVGSPLFIGLTLPFAVAYLSDRPRNWWALIPGGVMLFLALTTLFVDSLGGEWIGALLLFMIALSFLFVYLNDRTRFWALIVTYVTGVLSLAPIMATGGGDTAAYFGPIFLLAVGLPFLYVYLRAPAERWWAIIPAGVLSVLAVIAALGIAGFIRDERQGAYINALLMAGLAITFGVLWLRHNMAWARIVTLILAAVAVVSAFFASYAELFWPIAIILIGAYVLYRGFRPKTA